MYMYFPLTLSVWVSGSGCGGRDMLLLIIACIHVPSVHLHYMLLSSTMYNVIDRYIWQCRYRTGAWIISGVSPVTSATIALTLTLILLGIDTHIVFLGMILAALHYGFLVIQIPSGLLTDKIGAKYVFGIGVLMSSVFTLLIPLSASVGVWCVVLVRVLAGLFEV